MEDIVIGFIIVFVTLLVVIYFTGILDSIKELVKCRVQKRRLENKKMEVEIEERRRRLQEEDARYDE